MGTRTDWSVAVFAGPTVSGAVSESQGIAAARDPSAALAEAVQWLARLGSGLSAAQIDALRAWLRADPFNRQVLYEMAEVYDNVHAVTGFAPPRFEAPNGSRRFVPTLVE